MKELLEFPGYFATLEGKIYSAKTNKILSETKDKNGYCRLTLKNRYGKYKSMLVHRLIAQCFIDNNDNKKEVNHIDGIKHNNSPSNLEWCTRSENIKHAFSKGLKIITPLQIELLIKRAKERTGFKHPNSVKIINIKSGEVFPSVRDAGIKNGIKSTTLTMMLTGSNSNRTDLRYFRDFENKEMIMSVFDYSILLGKSVSNVTKHIRNNNSLPYVIKVDREICGRKYILTVSPSIKLKQPLK